MRALKCCSHGQADKFYVLRIERARLSNSALIQKMGNKYFGAFAHAFKDERHTTVFLFNFSHPVLGSDLGSTGNNLCEALLKFFFGCFFHYITIFVSEKGRIFTRI
jgi:hypothetical protein